MRRRHEDLACHGGRRFYPWRELFVFIGDAEWPSSSDSKCHSCQSGISSGWEQHSALPLLQHTLIIRAPKEARRRPARRAGCREQGIHISGMFGRCTSGGGGCWFVKPPRLTMGVELTGLKRAARMCPGLPHFGKKTSL